MDITFAILTVSDTCSQKLNEDKSGPALEKHILESFPKARIISKKIIPDEIDVIEIELLELCAKSCNVVLTTGGTGFSERDVTPEATKRVIERDAPGISYAMILKSLQVTDMAMLSRAVCGIRGRTLIINLPGSVKGATECFNFVKASLNHAVHLLTDRRREVRNAHEILQRTGSNSKVKVNQTAMRNRQSPYKMLDVEEALKLVLDNCPGTKEMEIINIEDSLNRILAEDVYTAEPFPRFRASIKDGYAVKTEDGVGVRVVKDAVAAGDDPESGHLSSGEVYRISTGAAVPSGADAVVQVEDTELFEANDGKEMKIKINVAPVLGQDIREVGSDILANELVLSKGSKLKASQVGVLATIGKTTVSVFRRPSIGVLSTGNELQRHDEKLRPGHIRDSNKLTLLNLLIEYGYKGHDCGIAKDEPNSVKEAIERALEKHDLLVTTGGVSMGEFDLIKEVLQKDFGAIQHFGRLDMKPGKPTTFSTCVYKNRKKYFFGLPGNPVSATVTSLLFVIPAIRSLENLLPHQLPHISVVMNEDIKLDTRPEYRRIRLERSNSNNNTFMAYSTGNQISSRLNSFIGAQALALVPSIGKYKSNILKKGEILPALLFDFDI